MDCSLGLRVGDWALGFWVIGRILRNLMHVNKTPLRLILQYVGYRDLSYRVLGLGFGVRVTPNLV